MGMNNNNKNKHIEAKLLLSVGCVFRCKPEVAEGILDYVKSKVELIYVKQSYGRLWIRESIPDVTVDGGMEGFEND
jgi:hypothetical protein